MINSIGRPLGQPSDALDLDGKRLRARRGLTSSADWASRAGAGSRRIATNAMSAAIAATTAPPSKLASIPAAVASRAATASRACAGSGAAAATTHARGGELYVGGPELQSAGAGSVGGCVVIGYDPGITPTRRPLHSAPPCRR
jgi:hypothetical protein